MAQDKPGTLKIIDGVEHVMGPDGNYTPSDANQAMRQQFMNAGKSLFGKLKGAMQGEAAAAPSPTPQGPTINEQVGKPF